MKNQQNYRTTLAAGKPKLYVLMGLLTLASMFFACNNNSSKAKPDLQNDTSSAVTKRVDTVAADSGTKQP
ncbi:hypothetical protein [uncultured Mucilaginibacter sp.]|uniref:hypothetical protein n=1 Tax=uncultured Mucilaginibacter sp. TaxID=797541 RepID=UPI0026246C87|nr:hypothetical protein [uncultured Mucilaginibacter sp.]